MGAMHKDDGAHRELPDLKTISEAGEVRIKDREGKETALKSLWTDRPENERQLIIFIRHFYCGSCKQYVQALVQDLPQEKLSNGSITVTIIGCGEPVCISPYAQDTGCPFPIYADPGVRSYRILGMTSNMMPGDRRPDYLKEGALGNVVSSTWKLLTSGHPLSSGPKAQNGGEWLFQGGEVKWCHRMRNSADHTETKDLKEVLGLD